MKVRDLQKLLDVMSPEDEVAIKEGGIYGHYDIEQVGLVTIPGKTCTACKACGPSKQVVEIRVSQ